MSHFLKTWHGRETMPRQTSGHTIRWAFAYDFVVRVLTLNRESAHARGDDSSGAASSVAPPYWMSAVARER